MKKIPFYFEEHTKNDEQMEKLSYFVLLREVDVPGWANLESYGVEIRLGDESAAVDDVTLSSERIKGIVKSLADWHVTPVHLREALEDLLAGQLKFQA